jgi:hypothetical protein
MLRNSKITIANICIYVYRVNRENYTLSKKVYTVSCNYTKYKRNLLHIALTIHAIFYAIKRNVSSFWERLTRLFILYFWNLRNKGRFCIPENNGILGQKMLLFNRNIIGNSGRVKWGTEVVVCLPTQDPNSPEHSGSKAYSTTWAR